MTQYVSKILNTVTPTKKRIFLNWSSLFYYHHVIGRGFSFFYLREIYNYCTGFGGFMNTRGESLCLPDDIAVQMERKLGYTKGWNDRKFHDLNTIEEVIRESTDFTDFTEFPRILKERMAELERNVG